MNREEAQNKCIEMRKQIVGSRYRHFKGTVYEVLDLVVHSETAEIMVIYCAFDELLNAKAEEWEKVKIWARQLEMFESEVDHEKYPEVKQKMRFERIG